MTRSVNKVIVLGHLGRDAETNFTPSGVAVTKFSVATSRRWKDSQSDEWKEETDWHNIVLWRSENLANFLTKGKQVYVEGRLQTRSYEDRDGVKRYVTEIVADGVILLGGQQGGSQDQPSSGKSNNNGLVSQPRGRAAAASAPPADDSSSQQITDDDVPFDSGPRGS
jgi:single-strand DNA-binding protein